MLRRNLICVAAAVCFLALAGCDEDGPEDGSNGASFCDGADCTPAGDVLIEVVSPKAGDTYSVGQTVTIEVKVNPLQVVNAVPAVTIDGGRQWNDISEHRKVPEESGCLCIEWVIGQETNSPTYSGSMENCKVKVYDYEFQFQLGVSGVFTIVVQ